MIEDVLNEALDQRREAAPQVRCASRAIGADLVGPDLISDLTTNVRLALAGWYQGARAVRERGLYSETKEFVRIVLALYGTV